MTCWGLISRFSLLTLLLLSACGPSRDGGDDDDGDGAGTGTIEVVTIDGDESPFSFGESASFSAVYADWSAEVDDVSLDSSIVYISEGIDCESIALYLAAQTDYFESLIPGSEFDEVMFNTFGGADQHHAEVGLVESAVSNSLSNAVSSAWVGWASVGAGGTPVGDGSLEISSERVEGHLTFESSFGGAEQTGWYEVSISFDAPICPSS